MKCTGASALCGSGLVGGEARTSGHLFPGMFNSLLSAHPPSVIGSPSLAPRRCRSSKVPSGTECNQTPQLCPTGPESTPPVLSPPPTPEPHIRVCAPLVLSAQDNYPPHTPQEPKEPPSRSAPPSEVSDFGRCPSFTYLYPPRVLILTYFWTG